MINMGLIETRVGYKAVCSNSGCKWQTYSRRDATYNDFITQLELSGWHISAGNNILCPKCKRNRA